MRCALIQYNPKVGSIEGNLAKIQSLAREAHNLGASLAVFPEMAIIGYPPRDLLLYPFLISEAQLAVSDLAQSLSDIDLTVIVGSVAFYENGPGRSLQNVAYVLKAGEITGRYAKRLLPTYDVFDEARYFEPGDAPLVVVCGPLRLALSICEDIWNDMSYWPQPLYRFDPVSESPPFDVLINLSASPFSVAKQDLREDLLANLALRYKADVLYVNQVGANDELIFDGRSLHVNRFGEVSSRAKAFEEDLLMVELEKGPEISLGSSSKSQ
ncbi:MAG: NAD+ synthase, partial [Deltaproteobacteria bacterium]|nr:NAD+ synthase [Deltaproteobacteria bacterium]